MRQDLPESASTYAPTTSGAATAAPASSTATARAAATSLTTACCLSTASALGLLLGLASKLDGHLAVEDVLPVERGDGAFGFAWRGKVDEGIAHWAASARVDWNRDGFTDEMSALQALHRCGAEEERRSDWNVGKCRRWRVWETYTR